jgi:predicted amino acid dehydrogenase
VIPVIIGATGTISKSLKRYLSNVPGKHDITARNCKQQSYRALHTLRKVLMESAKRLSKEIALHVLYVVSTEYLKRYIT